MAIELIVNVLLMVGSVFCYWYVGATMPTSPESEMGAEQWPQLLLVLLIIAIGFNLYNYFKSNKKEDIAAAFADFFPSVFRFVKSKLFIGMFMLMLMAVLYEPLGFITTCLLFMIGYGLLLGARRLVPLILSSAVIMVILYVGFSVFLGIMLPRGWVPFLRSFALFVESLFGR
ncbi:MAG: tripartite tricarboxylate transporter TctB family protein [Candidatus Accumulibacter sp.]|jgi:hypothetical protein|nr:tripartite tricarboxylate transporter TctB family protein [Accumulibacter sp.]